MSKKRIRLKAINTYPNDNKRVFNGNQEHSIIIHSKEHYDQLLFELENEDIKELKPSEISSKINKGFGGMSFFSLTPEGLELDIYRVRKDDGNVVESDISHFWHGPSRNEYGRVNLKNQRVFYGSLTPHGALMEVQDGPGDYYVTRWKLRFKDQASQMIMFGFDGTVREGTSFISKSIKKAMQTHFSSIPEPYRKNAHYKFKKYQEIFTSKYKKHYHLSASMANNFLSLNLTEASNMFVITYPSVAKDLNDINFAIRQEFAENPEYLSIQSAIKVHLKEVQENGILIDSSRKAIVEDKKLVWHSLRRQPFATKLGNIELTFCNGEVQKNVDSEKVTVRIEKELKSFSQYIQEDVLTQNTILDLLWSFNQAGDHLKDNHLDYGFTWPLGLITENLYVQIEGKERHVTSFKVPVIFRDTYLRE